MASGWQPGPSVGAGRPARDPGGTLAGNMADTS